MKFQNDNLKLYLGSDAVHKMYLGDNLVYLLSGSPIQYDFEDQVNPFTKISPADFVISSTQKHGGTYAISRNSGGASEAGDKHIFKVNTELVWTCWVRYAYSNNYIGIRAYNEDDITQYYNFLVNDLIILLYKEGTSLDTDAFTTGQLTAGDWLKLEVTVTDSPHTLHLKAYNAAETLIAHCTTTDSSYENVFFALRCGNTNGDGNYWDDISLEGDYVLPVNRLYYADNEVSRLYELDPSDMTTIDPHTQWLYSPMGVGGISDRLYVCDGSTSKVIEVDIDTCLVLSEATVSDSYVHCGIGGTVDRLYSTGTDWATNAIAREHDVDTKLTLSSTSMYTGNWWGIGGVRDRLFLADSNADNLHELDLDTKLAISTVSAVSATIRALGGTRTQLFVADPNTSQYEIDPDTLLSLGTYTLTTSSPWGIGGVK